MLEHAMKLAERITGNTLRDGEVQRTEFEPGASSSGWPLIADPEVRRKVEQFVLRTTPTPHRYTTADGDVGIVYFDERGRAASCKLSEISDLDLERIASQRGRRKPGEKDRTKPQTSRTDHGYNKPVQESEELVEAGNPKKDQKVSRAFFGVKRDIEALKKAVESGYGKKPGEEWKGRKESLDLLEKARVMVSDATDHYLGTY